MYIFEYILWYLLAFLIIILIKFLFRKIKKRLWLQIIIILFELFLGVLLAYLIMTGPNWYIQEFTSAFYIILFIDPVAKIILLFKKEYKFKTYSLLSFILCTLFLIYGIINMQIVNPKYLNFESNKLKHDYKIAFMADLHIGSSQSIDISKKTINKIKEENPDFIFLGGDIIDSYTKKEEMIEVLNEFKDFNNPIYFIYGNHDVELTFGASEFEKCLKDNNILIIKDEYVKLAADLTLLGREDDSISDRIDIEKLVNPYDDTYLIALDHQPFKFKDNCKAKIDLQLSGHTHAGQLFPLRMIYDTRIPAYGTYYNGDAILNVSSGASGWLFTLRTEVGCQFEIINLRGLNDD